MKTFFKIFAGGAALLVFLALIGAGFLKTHFKKNIPLADEHALKVTLEAGFGDIVLSKGEKNSVLSADVDIDRDGDMDHCIEYDVRDGVGYLNLSTDCKLDDSEERHHGKSIHIEGLDSRTWQMKFTNAVPIAFDISLGLGKGDIDMSDLAVNDFTLSTGASSVNLRWDKPNKDDIEDMNIEAGVSSFRAEGLCNARFHHLKFDGGVGTYSLDFGGKLDHEVDGDLQVGLGTLTITIPGNVGAKIVYEKSWISHLDIDPEFRESSTDDNTYISSNYRTAKGRITLHIDAGLGSVRIRTGGSSSD